MRNILGDDVDERPATQQPDGYEFTSVYANNTYFESSAWDLKIIFGQLEQHTGKATVDWNTAVTLPWAYAKVLLYYLQVHLAVHESLDGQISIPRRVVPMLPELPPQEADRPGEKELHQRISQIHREVFGDTRLES